MDTPEWDDYVSVAGDIYYTHNLQQLSEMEQHLKIDRLAHIRSVAYLSFIVSKKLDLDYVSTARGATLHDLFYYDWRAKDYNVHRLHGYRHPGFALKNALDLCGTLNDKEVNIIKRHMWPLTVIPPKYPESFVVTAMDKYCASIELCYSFSEKFRNKIDDNITIELINKEIISSSTQLPPSKLNETLPLGFLI